MLHHTPNVSGQQSAISGQQKINAKKCKLRISDTLRAVVIKAQGLVPGHNPA
jgi:hypothetical protein